MSIPLVKVPRYQMTLPSTGEVIEFRPFLVKEEKLLIMAKDSGNKEMIVSTVGDIVKDCTNGKVDAATSPMFDVQYAFLQIRGKSIGEDIEYYLVCGKCGHKVTAFTNVEDFKLIKQEGHTNSVILDEEMRLTMKYPTFVHFNKLFGESEEGDAKADEIAAECVESIITKDEVIMVTKDNLNEVQTLIDNMLPEQGNRLEKFFETMPELQCRKEFDCLKCETKNVVVIGGINNFFV